MRHILHKIIVKCIFIMSWIKVHLSMVFAFLALKVIRTGEVPRHVAFIIDGNRRYAEIQKIPRSISCAMGDSSGVSDSEDQKFNLGAALQANFHFSFSVKGTGKAASNKLILNAAKTQAIIFGSARYINAINVTLLPNLSVGDIAIEFLTHIKYLGVTIANNLSWDRQLASLRKVGSVLYQLRLSRHFLPETLRSRLVKAFIFPHFDYCCTAVTNITAEQNLKLYRAMNAARDELTHAIKEITIGIMCNDILLEDITENLISDCLYTYKSSNLDLLIRTSGEVRLSDFLMWQVSTACLYFTNTLWPEFDLWDLLRAIFYYQTCYSDLQKIRNNSKTLVPNTRVSKFVDKLHRKREIMIKNIYKSSVQSKNK
ncbi:isoprenyl transferase-like [Solenopsis invicta]|uniref:isoprenyl transferase-like n=1 Tax=Solenopsis invicta TaxID=13686 RepID=UPI00193E1FC9|nr:isoprenyl transferase-like [Solenopsis invicta]